jgi:hypothetical protein
MGVVKLFFKHTTYFLILLAQPWGVGTYAPSIMLSLTWIIHSGIHDYFYYIFFKSYA